MKYVVSGYIGFDNFGDEAIANVLTQKLKKEGAEKITLISSNPDKTRIIHDVESCGMLKFFNSLKDADVLISGGGSLLQDVTSLKSLLYYLFVIYTALFLGKKVEIFAQGIGPINSEIGKLLTKFALKKASYISVRDKKSQELLSTWNIKSDLVQDPIFSIDIPNIQKRNSVGIQLRKFKSLNDEFLKSLARSVANKFKDKEIVILSLQDSIDIEPCTKFLQYLSEYKVNNVELKTNLNVNQVIQAIASLEYLIAMRFHANVIGIKANVKTIAINYDPKVEKLAKEYSLPIIELNNQSPELFFN